jgi:excisionase family DNA binding protein
MPTELSTPPSSTLLIGEAAKLLGVSRRTIYYRIRDGRLLTIRTRGGSQRVLRTSIEELRVPVARSVATGYRDVVGAPAAADD